MVLNMEMLRAPENLKTELKELKDELYKATDPYFKNNNKAQTVFDEELTKIVKKYTAKIKACEGSIKDHYKGLFEDNPLKVIDDIKLVLREINRNDFLVWFEFTTKLNIYDRLKEGHEAAVLFLEQILYLQISILSEHNNDTETASDLINKKAAEWYEENAQNKKTGSIVNVNNIPSLVVSHKDYKNALTCKPNDNAYLFCSNQVTMSFDKEGNAFLNYVPEKMSSEQLLKEGYNEGLFGVVLAATFRAWISGQPDTTISIKEFAQEIEADIRAKDLDNSNTKHHGTDIIRILENNTKFMGRIDNETYKMFNIKKYDFDNNTVTFESPYYRRLIQILDANKAFVLADAKDNIKYEIMGYTDIVKGSIATAKNRKTAAAVRYIAGVIARRGTKPDQKIRNGKKYKDKELITCAVSFEDLVYNIPIIEEVIIGKPAKRRSDILKSIFGSNSKPLLIEYIKKYTVIYDKYIDVKISVPVPSWSCIKDEIIITHKGIKGEFKNPYALISDPLIKSSEQDQRKSSKNQKQ